MVHDRPSFVVVHLLIRVDAYHQIDGREREFSLTELKGMTKSVFSVSPKARFQKINRPKMEKIINAWKKFSESRTGGWKGLSSHTVSINSNWSVGGWRVDFIAARSFSFDCLLYEGLNVFGGQCRWVEDCLNYGGYWRLFYSSQGVGSWGIDTRRVIILDWELLIDTVVA